MYNRYIPTPDGSYRKSQMPEPAASHCDASCGHCHPAEPPRTADSFLKNLLPSQLDTGDLLVILLLLLIAGDSEKEKNHALLTLALYFIL